MSHIFEVRKIIYVWVTDRKKSLTNMQMILEVVQLA